MHAPLHASAPDFPFRSFGIHGNSHAARFPPLAYKHHGHPASKRTILVLPRPRCATHPVFVASQACRRATSLSPILRRNCRNHRNSIQSRVRLVTRPSAKELDGESHPETAHFFVPSLPRQREA